MMQGLIKSQNSKSDIQYSNGGFTLIELIVATALFSILISVVTGGFIQALRAQRAVAGLLSANSNLSLTMEQMAREIRTGTNFTSSGQSLSFTNGKGEGVTYCLNSARKGIEKSINGPCGSGAVITSATVEISGLDFFVTGNVPGDDYPTRVVVHLAASGNTDAAVRTSIFHLETTISARDTGT